jgi:Protein of unknown function (DUF3072)
MNSTKPAAHTDSSDQPFRDPSEWKTGDEPITASQKSYLETLATEAGEHAEKPEELNKAEASVRIEELKEKTGRAGH